VRKKKGGDGLDSELTEQFLPYPEEEERRHEIDEQPAYLRIEFPWDFYFGCALFHVGPDVTLED
jgi:hypothetical protein